MKKLSLLLLIISSSLFAQTKQLDRVVGQELDITDTWVDSFKYEYTYNTNHICTDEIEYEMNDADEWEIYSETHYTLNADNKVSEILFQEDDEAANKELISYDIDGNIEEQINMLWNDTSNQFENSNKRIHSYTNNLKTETISYYWNTSQWNESEKSTYQYNTDNLIELVEIFSYDTATNQWESQAEEKITYQYNTDNKLIEKTSYYFNASWIPEEKEEFIYDANLNVVESIYNYWDEDNQNWVIDAHEYLTEYDNTVGQNNLILPFSFEYYGDASMLYFNHQLNHFESYYDGELEEKYDLFYSDITASTSDISNEVLSIYPNPFTNELSINFPTQEKIDLSLFDIQGRKVFNKTILSNQKVTISSLENGIYFYEAITNDYKFKGKLIKK